MLIFQSMGICFIGERDFENFILEVSQTVFLHTTNLGSCSYLKMKKHDFFYCSILSLNQETLCPLKMEQ